MPDLRQHNIEMNVIVSIDPQMICGEYCSVVSRELQTIMVLCFFVLSYYVSLHSEFHVVISVTISALKRCWIRLYLLLFVGELMSCVPYVTSFSGLSIFDCPLDNL